MSVAPRGTSKPQDWFPDLSGRVDPIVNQSIQHLFKATYDLRDAHEHNANRLNSMQDTPPSTNVDGHNGLLLQPQKGAATGVLNRPPANDVLSSDGSIIHYKPTNSIYVYDDKSHQFRLLGTLGSSLGNSFSALAPSNVSNSGASAPGPLDSTGVPTTTSPIPPATPQVNAIPAISDPLSVVGQRVLVNGVPYVFTAGLVGPNGYWALDVTGSPSIRDTFANLSLYPAANYPVSTVFYATDFLVSYAVQNTDIGLQWVYYNGIYQTTLASIPGTLGVKDRGFLFRASDYLHNWLWTGTVWSLFAAIKIGFGGGLPPGTTMFNVGGPPFGGAGSLWHACDGSMQNVSQENATIVSQTLPNVSNEWFVR